MSDYGQRHSRPMGAGDKAFGGAGSQMSLFALDGESDMITTFDDFNDFMIGTQYGVVSNADGTVNMWEECGWTMVDDPTTGPTAELISMNDQNVTSADFDSCIRIFI